MAEGVKESSVEELHTNLLKGGQTYDLVEEAQWETAFQTYNSKVSIKCIVLSITDDYQV